VAAFYLFYSFKRNFSYRRLAIVWKQEKNLMVRKTPFAGCSNHHHLFCEYLPGNYRQAVEGAMSLALVRTSCGDATLSEVWYHGGGYPA